MIFALASVAFLSFPPPDCSHLGAPSLPPATANDNRVPAGTLRDGVLTVRLVAQRATWYPEGRQGVRHHLSMRRPRGCGWAGRSW